MNENIARYLWNGNPKKTISWEQADHGEREKYLKMAETVCEKFYDYDAQDMMGGHEDNTSLNAPEVEIFVLEEWDGGDGTRNPPVGLLTENQMVADFWSDSGMGRSYRSFRGRMIKSTEQISQAFVNLEKDQALSKLTSRERKILGLE